MSKGFGSRTALYRFYGVNDQLLYVGITDRLGARWESHMRNKPWWPDVRRQTVQWYPTRTKAAAAEVVAIVDEHPRYNILHSTRRRNSGEFDLALSALDTAARALRQAKELIEAATQGDCSTGTVDVDKLLADLTTAVASERVRLSVLPELLCQVDPMYLPYRNLKGSHIAEILRSRGIRITNTGNVRRIDPADLRREAS